jgi:hypothetical protein
MRHNRFISASSSTNRSRRCSPIRKLSNISRGRNIISSRPTAAMSSGFRHSSPAASSPNRSTRSKTKLLMVPTAKTAMTIRPIVFHCIGGGGAIAARATTAVTAMDRRHRGRVQKTRNGDNRG